MSTHASPLCNCYICALRLGRANYSPKLTPAGGCSLPRTLGGFLSASFFRHLAHVTSSSFATRCVGPPRKACCPQSGRRGSAGSGACHLTAASPPACRSACTRTPRSRPTQSPLGGHGCGGRKASSAVSTLGVLQAVGAKQHALSGGARVTGTRAAVHRANLCARVECGQRCGVGSGPAHGRSFIRALRNRPPNPSLNLTRYGMRRLAATVLVHHCSFAASRRMPPQAG